VQDRDDRAPGLMHDPVDDRQAWLVPSLTMTRATSGRSVAVNRATSGSDDCLAITS
jgi:hypothetical protein